MRINLGAGLDARDGYMNVDRRALAGIQVVHDLDRHPWPFADDSATEILALDVFEHLLDVEGAVNECWRILRTGGTLTIRGPLPDSPNLWVDVTHRRAFVEGSFDHFDRRTDFGQRYRYGVGDWQIMERRREGTNIVFVMAPEKTGPEKTGPEKTG